MLEALLSWVIELVLVFKTGLVPLGCSLPRSEHCYHFIAIDPQVIYSNGHKKKVFAVQELACCCSGRHTGGNQCLFVHPRGFTELHKHEQVSPDPPDQGWLLSVRFYAGGSERSGQQIVGPPRKKSPNELVEDLFKGAKEHGAVAVDRMAKSGGETSKPKVRSSSFCSSLRFHCASCSVLRSPGIISAATSGLLS